MTVERDVKGSRSVTVGIGLKEDDLIEIKESLSELNQLVEAIGSEIVGSLTQRVAQWTPATLIGSGKTEELKTLVEETSADLVVVDHPLTGAQARNLSEIVGITVIDRTQLIIEIFARRAQTHEGKLQVELARLLDQFTRQVGAWHGSLSRQGGGIGTRGPGEKAIELDRRVIRDKISKIRKELESTRQHRALHRASRRRNKVPSFALIGYTNAGKSTLLQTLTKTETYVADQVFATLDPTTRKVYLPSSIPAVVTDTVGFIRKLPTHLVEAFKATLEESQESDVLIHVIDFSSQSWEAQISTVEKLIKEFNWDKKPIIHVFNKTDIAPENRKFQVKHSPRVFMSAMTGEGIDDLKQEMIKQINLLTQKVELFFDNNHKYLIFELGREALITKQEEASTGTLCVVALTPQQISKWKAYFVSEGERNTF